MEFGTFNLNAVARKNILELVPYRCARDVNHLHVYYFFFFLSYKIENKDYSTGVLLDANENSVGPSIKTHSHLELNRFLLYF